jgi:hypothetical protein
MKNNEQQQNLSTRLSNAKLLTLLEHLMMFINEDGSPVDGFRFREVTIGIKAALQSTPPVSQPVEELYEAIFHTVEHIRYHDIPIGSGVLGKMLDAMKLYKAWKDNATPNPLDGEKGDGGEGKEN